VLVNCVTANHSRGCDGGDPTAAFSYILSRGITDDSCSNYLAKNEACISLGRVVALHHRSTTVLQIR
jgi:cathepsin X